MGRHRHGTLIPMDYFETRAEELEDEQRDRYAENPPADDDLTRHLREERVTRLIQDFRLISATYQQH